MHRCLQHNGRVIVSFPDVPGVALTQSDRHNTPMLVINDMSLRIGDKWLLKEASVSVPLNARVGLIGRNGVGKTTLFRAITGDLPPDHGDIALPANARVGRLTQEAPDGPQSI